MKAKEIRDLIDFIAHSSLDEVHIETEEFKITVKRYSGTAKPVETTITSSVTSTPVPTASLPAASTSQQPETSPKTVETKPSTTSSTTNYITIKSPMIGTFYRAPKPDAPNFVNVGDEIKPGQVVCIIEAMKLFNEIESEVAGRIVKVLVENASPVEYDQPLFLVEPL